jgi:hypothetical protein
MSMFLPVPYSFNYCGFVIYLKSGNVMPPVFSFSRLFCLLRVFCGSIWILEFFPHFCKTNVTGILIEIALNLWIVLSCMVILIILSVIIHEHKIPFHLSFLKFLSFLSFFWGVGSRECTLLGFELKTSVYHLSHAPIFLSLFRFLLYFSHGLTLLLRMWFSYYSLLRSWNYSNLPPK